MSIDVKDRIELSTTLEGNEIRWFMRIVKHFHDYQYSLTMNHDSGRVTGYFKIGELGVETVDELLAYFRELFCATIDFGCYNLIDDDTIVITTAARLSNFMKDNGFKNRKYAIGKLLKAAGLDYPNLMLYDMHDYNIIITPGDLLRDGSDDTAELLFGRTSNAYKAYKGNTPVTFIDSANRVIECALYETKRASKTIWYDIIPIS